MSKVKAVQLTRRQLTDHIAALTQGVTDNFLLGLRESNPALLQMFRDKNTAPYRRLLPWSGEFVGKYLTSTALIYRLLGDERLREESLAVAAELLTCQEPNGYLGPYPKAHQLTGTVPAIPELDDPIPENTAVDSWDAWGHYHIMTGLLAWYDITGDKALLDCVLRMAELFMRVFYGDTGRRLIDIGWPEMNLAPYHIFARLYNRTGQQRYLDFAKEVELDCADERGGNYLHYAQQNLPFYQCPKPRWESLHAILGFAEMAHAVDDPGYLAAAQQIFDSILETDVHNTGGFSTFEQAVGNPYKFGAVETCCVVAYNALALQLYGETGDGRYVDHLEKSLYNAMAGSFNKTGRWSTYNTPMEGFRRANFHEIGFQCRPGGPELNCCSVNAPRGLGMLADWAWVLQDGALLINYYGAGSITTVEGDHITVEGDYPFDGQLHIKASLTGGKKLRLRIPGFAGEGMTVSGDFVREGEYFESAGSEVDAEMYIPLLIRIEKGAEDCAGRYCIYRGPLLLGYDRASNPDADLNSIPTLTMRQLESAAITRGAKGGLTLTVPLRPKEIRLQDFYTLGQTGSWYTTWLYETK